jgi:predicted RNase H-like HicB family nuclease
MASEGCSSDQRLTEGHRQSGRRTFLRKAQPRAIIRAVTRIVHVPYVVEQDEDGVWCASAQLRPGVAAFGDGPTQEAAIADLREGLELLIEEVGPPDELTLTLDVA